jgi:hypothetical protein
LGEGDKPTPTKNSFWQDLMNKLKKKS